MSDPILLSPKNAAFADIWYEAREQSETGRGTGIPAKSDISMRRLAPLMSQIALIQIDAKGVSHYILHGTGLATGFGRDLTGTPMHETMDENTIARLAVDFGAFYAEHGVDAPFGRGASGHAQTSTGRVIAFESLTLPYFEQNDGSIRYMMHCLPLETLKYGEAMDPYVVEDEARMLFAAGDRPGWLYQNPNSYVLIDADQVA